MPTDGVADWNVKLTNDKEKEAIPVKQTRSQTEKDFTRFIALHAGANVATAMTTTASTAYNSVPVNVSKAQRVRVLLQSNNQGTLNVLYTYDGTFWFAVAITGVLDPVSAKYVYEWSKDSPIAQVKYTYTETVAVGAILGGVAVSEKVVV